MTQMTKLVVRRKKIDFHDDYVTGVFFLLFTDHEMNKKKIFVCVFVCSNSK